MAEAMSDSVQDLADGLSAAANTDDDPQATPAESWQQLTRYALGQAGIELDADQFERAWRTAWRRAFMGGSYVQDARAILKAVGERR